MMMASFVFPLARAALARFELVVQYFSPADGSEVATCAELFEEVPRLWQIFVPHAPLFAFKDTEPTPMIREFQALGWSRSASELHSAVLRMHLSLLFLELSFMLFPVHDEILQIVLELCLRLSKRPDAHHSPHIFPSPLRIILLLQRHALEARISPLCAASIT